MRKFVFRLESLLKYRQVTLHEAEQQLALQNQKYTLILESIAQCQDEQRKMFMVYGTEKNPIQDMGRAEIYRQGLQSRIDSHKKELSVLEKTRATAQAAYLQQKKYHRALELLKEKELHAYKIKKNRYTEKVLDDVLLLAQKYTENL